MPDNNIVEESEIDALTGLCKKNKFSQMISEYYPDKKRIGVIFWDINGLKHINDMMGLRYGDFIVKTIASSIFKFVEEKTLAYRVGGDEFVMIVESATDERMKEMISAWQYDLDMKNRGRAKFSAAVGYAIGEGGSINDTINQAKLKMYADKLAKKTVQ